MRLGPRQQAMLRAVRNNQGDSAGSYAAALCMPDEAGMPVLKRLAARGLVCCDTASRRERALSTWGSTWYLTREGLRVVQSLGS